MFNYVVESNKFVAKNILSLRLKASGLEDIFAYNPGQYACLSFIHNGRRSPARCFSIASSPHQRGILEFGIRTEGDYTTSLTKLKPGDLIEVQGPFGNFLDNTVRGGEIVFFAGGIGLTPFLSAVRLAAQLNWRNPWDKALSHGSQKITLFYSVRTFDDAAYINELADLQNSSPNFDLHLFLSKEDASIYNSRRIASGQISGEAIDRILKNNFAGKKFFICGPGAFMAAMRTNLTARNISPKNILTEEFSASGNEDSVGGSPDKKITKYVLAGVIASAVLIALTDASQYNSRLNAAASQNTTTNSAVTVPNNNYTTPDSSNAGSTNSPASTSTTNNNSTGSNNNSSISPPSSSSTNNNYNQYTPPRTRVS